MPFSTTQARRATIRQILAEQAVHSQAELLGELEAAGCHTTQPVLSRDLRALQAAKQGGVYQLLEGERITPLETLRSLLRDVRSAGHNLVVVICEPGAASAVARAIEAEESEGLVGTVAGDDTVFAAVTGENFGENLRERVLALLA